RSLFGRETVLLFLTLVVTDSQGRTTNDREERLLDFYHTHTGQELTVVYFANGEYLPQALDQVNAFLRDFRNGEVIPIDPGLLDLLHQIKLETKTESPFEVISAYRSPQTNEILRSIGRGVAEISMHLQGKAIDIRLRDVGLAELRTVALDLERGGVGYYVKSNFVHIDTGRVRRW
ncbi:MAG: DUF882 domain-containing protein, partial [Pseudomonadales bacterium]